MNLILNLFSSLFPNLPGAGSARERELGIDASVRFALLGLIKASVFWLLIASFFGLVTAIKLHLPSCLSDIEALSYGRTYPVFWNTLVYGWLINGGIACVAWMTLRLGGNPSRSGGLLAISSGAWNTAVLIGVAGILKGDQTPYRMLEFPAYSAPFLFAAYAGMGIWILLAFRARAYRSAFATQWHAIAGVFCFAWIYSIAQLMIFCYPSQGVFQSVIAAWFGSNLYYLVVAPFAFGAMYYLIPKVLGQHIVGYRQSSMAFWSWIAFASVSGLAFLANGPFPGWLASVGVIGSFGLLLPLTIFCIQFLSSLVSGYSRIWDTLSARFVAYAAVALLVATFLIVFGGLRSVQSAVQFSQFNDGVRYLFLVGFAGMAFMGGTYYMLPRLLNKEVPNTALADLQFWIHGLGIFMISASYVAGGITYGGLLNGSVADTVVVIDNTRTYLILTTLGASLFACGSFAYAVSFAWMLLSPRSAKEATAELIESAPEMEYTVS